ncbi:pentatricopeptide repeat-containing protein, partial [Trifolium medium]|nr:pentatricopeptide repeat-containing protein [Trifolium medium]
MGVLASTNMWAVVERILATPLVARSERIKCDKYNVVGNWNGIWKVQAQHKARHLLWRLCRGYLPTRYHLLQRRMECTLNCPVCDEEIKDELYMFFNCTVAYNSWCAAGLSSLEEWLCYSGAFGTTVMMKFGMTMSRYRAKSEDMPLMLGIIGTQFINYSATV